jgi:hypothetical protein
MSTGPTKEFLQLVAGVQLDNVRQLTGTFNATASQLPDLAHELTVGREYRFERRDSTLLVYIRFNCEVRPETGTGDTPSEPSFRAAAVFELHYTIPAVEFSEATLNQFAENNGAFNAWPYCREFVQQASVRAGLPAIALPVFRVSGKSTSHRSGRPPKPPVLTEK